MYSMKNMNDHCKMNMKFYGTSSIGERGQVVIPAEAREQFNIKAKDQLIFFGHGKVMHFIKADEIETLLEGLSENIVTNLNIVKDLRKEKYGKEKKSN